MRALAGLLLLALAAIVPACGDGDGSARDAAGRYELDRMDYARKLAAALLETKDGKPREGVTPKRRADVRKAAVEKARGIQLALELREDGAFMATVTDAGGEQRLGGTWTQDGKRVTFRTTAIPGGRVTTIPDVTARITAEGLEFDAEVSGFVVPHAFRVQRVD